MAKSEGDLFITSVHFHGSSRKFGRNARRSFKDGQLQGDPVRAQLFVGVMDSGRSTTGTTPRELGGISNSPDR